MISNLSVIYNYIDIIIDKGIVNLNFHYNQLMDNKVIVSQESDFV